MRHEFIIKVNEKIAAMLAGNADYIELRSGDIHSEVGGYPGANHRMPVCCDVMYEAMRGDDEIISKPRKGKGANLYIKYYRRNHKLSSI